MFLDKKIDKKLNDDDQVLLTTLNRSLLANANITPNVRWEMDFL